MLHILWLFTTPPLPAQDIPFFFTLQNSSHVVSCMIICAFHREVSAFTACSLSSMISSGQRRSIGFPYRLPFPGVDNCSSLQKYSYPVYILSHYITNLHVFYCDFMMDQQ
ncbi:hypothetical protein ILYODFUR_010210 [Ilyodon furcidens]|uniref:Uncharacterized protein n=1 Tax=Ilyodon furcidens TaxID=33524 RepID=A0ABV0SVZ7_9TELE